MLYIVTGRKLPWIEYSKTEAVLNFKQATISSKFPSWLRLIPREYRQLMIAYRDLLRLPEGELTFHRVFSLLESDYMPMEDSEVENLME